MLAMNPFLLSLLDTPHLLSALEAEGHLTPAEKELVSRLGVLSEQETFEEYSARLEKEYERQLEQSEFRAGLIDEILNLCELPGTKADLVKSIRAALENSYVEL